MLSETEPRGGPFAGLTAGLLLPDAVVPAEVNAALGDTRRLGLAFPSLRATCKRGG